MQGEVRKLGTFSLSNRKVEVKASMPEGASRLVYFGTLA